MNQNGLVYVVDDDLSVREGLASLVSSTGLTARTAGSGREFLGMERPDIPSCLVLDVNLPDLSGLELQQEFLKCGIQIPIIFLTGHGDIPMTVRALKAGAADFLTKPVDDEVLLNAIRESMDRYHATNAAGGFEYQVIDQEASPEQQPRGQIGFEQIIGTSGAIKHVLEMVETVAQSDSTALLLGETGTGKELIARAIHDHSRREGRPFVKLNCAAIPTGLLESELFGHEKGAFTGAISQKAGRLELADQGSLFLDEVGDIPIEVQPKLLRALQEREFERLGSAHTRKVNVRLIAATNRDLDKMVAEREFRSDLYYRLNVFPIRIPPLRERKEDIPLLVNHFVRRFTKQMQKRINGVPPRVMKGLMDWDWPGNIRELENFIERAVILSGGTSLDAPLFELRRVDVAPTPTPPLPHTGSEDIAEIVRKTLSSLAGGDQLHYPNANKLRDDIVRALTESKGRVGGPDGAAARLGVNRTTLIARLKKFGIDPRNFL